jgi:hypothetical protein
MNPDGLRTRIETGNFKFCKYTLGEQVVSAKIKSLEFDVYNNFLLLHITSSTERRLKSTSVQALRVNLTKISNFSDREHQLMFSAPPFYTGVAHLGLANIILSQKPV